MGEKAETKQELTKQELEKKAELKEDGGGEKKAELKEDGGGEKKDIEPNTVVLKLDLHCAGCAKKVTRSISQFEGVVKVKADCDAKTLTVMGNVDPFWLRERVESKTRKKVDLISYPQPKGAAGAGGENMTENKSEKKTEENEGGEEQKLPKEAVVTTVVMKIKLHCDGCAQKIKRVVLKNIDGVNSITMDLRKDLVSVTGTMDAKELATYLKERLKRAVDIVPPKKDEKNVDKKGDEKNEDKKGKEESKGIEEKKTKEGSGQETELKKEKENQDDGDKKKEGNKDKKEDNSQPEATKAGEEGRTMVEVNKTEYHSHIPQTYYEMPMNDQSFVFGQDYGMPSYYHYQHNYPMHYTQGPNPPSPTYLTTYDQTSHGDSENPSGCSVM